MSGQANKTSTSAPLDQATLASLRAKLADLLAKVAAIEAGINRECARWERIPLEERPDLSMFYYARAQNEKLKTKFENFVIQGERDAELFSQLDAILETNFARFKRMDDNWKNNMPPEMQDW